MIANVFWEDGRFRQSELVYEERVLRLTPLSEGPGEGPDYVVPGLVDIHTHGGVGCDASDGDPAGLDAMSRYYAKRGVTGFLATTMTLPEERLTRAVETAGRFRAGRDGARCLGVNMEGPFLSGAKKGAQNGADIVRPDMDLFRRLYAASGERIRLVDVAPETEGCLPFIREVGRLCRVSLAHTEADYETALAGLDAGADHVTHLFNAMPPFAHRVPGVVGAAMDRGAYAELIADGIHIHPSAVRGAFRLFGPERVCLISDSIRCAGLGDGSYELGGQRVNVLNGRATLPDGTIAGSSIHLMDALKNVLNWGIPLETALRAATVNPANSIGRRDAGRLTEGAEANFLIMDQNMELKDVYLLGRAL